MFFVIAAGSLRRDWFSLFTSIDRFESWYKYGSERVGVLHSVTRQQFARQPRGG
jgi:hypothetical protein